MEWPFQLRWESIKTPRYLAFRWAQNMKFLRASFCGANFNCLPSWLFQPVLCFWVQSLKAISWIVNSIIRNLKQIVKFKFLVHNFFRCLKMASYAAYVYGWIAWGWEAHFCNYRHYVSQCPVSTLDWLPNFPHMGLTWAKVHSLAKWIAVSGNRTAIACVAIEVHDHYTIVKINKRSKEFLFKYVF